MSADLIVVAPVEREESGCWWHPGMPEFEEGQESEWAAWIEAQGLEISRDLLQDEDCDHPAYVAIFDNGESSFIDWTCTPPRGEGWFTLAIFDSDDGPVWSWARRVENGGAA